MSTSDFDCCEARGCYEDPSIYFTQRDYQEYRRQKDIILKEYDTVAENFPHMYEKLYNPKLFFSVKNFNSKEEAYKKLSKIKELTKLLKIELRK